MFQPLSAQTKSSVLHKGVLHIGTAGDVTSLDPHFHNFGPNISVNSHIFDRLTYYDKGQLQPGLAIQWTSQNEHQWLFTLREKVRFHDGKTFTAKDVVFSFHRVRNVKKSPSSFVPYIRNIKDIRAVGDYQIEIETYEPDPLLPKLLSMIAIVSETEQEEATNSELKIVGTGPYQLALWKKNQHIKLKANPNYWGGPPQWAEITITPIPNETARVAALMSGDVDIIDHVPTQMVSLLSKNDHYTYQQYSSGRLIYLQMDQERDNSPFIRDSLGIAMDHNPFKDVRVRQAVSKAINRDELVNIIMDQMAIPAGQLVPEGFAGYLKNLGPQAYDPEGAKALLSSAGYAKGFQLTLHAPHDRYVNDEKIAFAIAAMLSKVGIYTHVETLPKTLYFKQASDLKFSFMLLGWASGTRDAFSPLKSFVHSHDRVKGYGFTNRGRYHNKHVDQWIEQAATTFDEDQRVALMQRATLQAIASDYALLPLHFQVNGWAYKNNLHYIPRYMSHVWSESVVPKPVN